MPNITIFKKSLTSSAYKIIMKDGRKIVGHVYLYLIKNDLHALPYGLLEDVFVKEEFRNLGFGSKLVDLAIKQADTIGCTKIIATSRKARVSVHRWYKKLGFKDYGLEFRKDLR